jgi:hypothetical protein
VGRDLKGVSHSQLGNSARVLESKYWVKLRKNLANIRTLMLYGFNAILGCSTVAGWAEVTLGCASADFCDLVRTSGRILVLNCHADLLLLHAEPLRLTSRDVYNRQIMKGYLTCPTSRVPVGINVPSAKCYRTVRGLPSAESFDIGRNCHKVSSRPHRQALRSVIKLRTRK